MSVSGTLWGSAVKLRTIRICIKTSNGEFHMNTSAKNIEKAVSQFGFTHQNLPALLCKKLNTLCIEPCFIKFFLVPTHDTHYRLRLRLSAFTDAIIAVQNWLVQQNQKKPFDTMSKISLDKFIISVNKAKSAWIHSGRAFWNAVILLKKLFSDVCPITVITER